jgi:hypothetical protein
MSLMQGVHKVTVNGYKIADEILREKTQVRSGYKMFPCLMKSLFFFCFLSCILGAMNC